MSRLIHLGLMICVVTLVMCYPEQRQIVQRNGNPRSSRGFQLQNGKLSTARGFGKRGNTNSGGEEIILSPISLESSSSSSLPSNFEIRSNYPTSWIIEEIQSNPELARYIVERLIDANADGEISADELLRTKSWM